MRFVTMLIAVTCALPAGAAAAAPAPVTVARYTFDSTGTGAIADQSGRGLPLRIRAADGGVLRSIPRGTGRAVVFPARCRATVTRCARVILEGGDDADLDPGRRPFRYGASIQATAAQTDNGANIMQKGVASTASQWKMQLGRRGKPNCALAGRGSRRIYLARATVSVTDGRWHHISCRRAGGTLTVFVDGAARGSVAVPTSTDIGNTMPLRVGGRNLNARADQYNGSIYDVYAILG